MRKSVTLLFLLAFVLNTYSQTEPALTYTYNKENVVASAIDGTWKNEEKNFQIAFQKDVSALSLIPEMFLEELSKYPIYHAGFLTYPEKEKEMKVPFLLTTIHGNPHVIFFRGKGEDPYGDSESFNLFIAKGKTKETDRLFIGGDFNNQEFRELVRID
ncbi:hypothetical protein [uncultured Kordia sp.]|uniref:hypothetical protein n=1 Tax=uncultured Kordia sp. TaxID=507699 RepID=UPI0026288056|nr:hypothetical protein [uncultured Kordia sp.]